MSANPGRALVSAILQGDTKKLHTLDLQDEYLKETDKDALSYIKQHVYSHGVIPDLSTLQNQVEMFQPMAVVEPASFYVEELKNQYFYRTINTAMKKAREGMKGINTTDPQTVALEVLTEAVLQLKFIQHGKKLVDFRDAYDMIKAEYITTQKGVYDNSIMLGWETPDAMSGGFRPGDVVSYVGRPGMGKTFSLLYSMHNAWWEQEKSVLMLSMEMIPLPLIQRLGAMHTRQSLTDLKAAEYTTKKKNAVFHQLEAAKGHSKPCWIADGNLTATVEDLKILCHQLEPDAVYVDGAYLLSPSSKYSNKWDKVTDTVEELKQDIATEMGITTLLSYQFNREAAKKAKKAPEDIGLEDIGLSDAIGQISTMVMALLENDSLETENQRKMTIMKGRNGESGSFPINWDFMTMNFSEVSEDEQSDLTFI
ncbi:MAG: hypothetical protein GQ570_03475 [Helicobacteraceae bacterium]|nr:hypothetical protein [Helicobacteraceae bacterium]